MSVRNEILRLFDEAHRELNDATVKDDSNLKNECVLKYYRVCCSFFTFFFSSFKGTKYF
jgi:hypothetical protein